MIPETHTIDLAALATELETAGWEASVTDAALTARFGHHRIEASPDHINAWSDFGVCCQTPNPDSPVWQSALGIVQRHVLPGHAALPGTSDDQPAARFTEDDGE